VYADFGDILKAMYPLARVGVKKPVKEFLEIRVIREIRGKFLSAHPITTLGYYGKICSSHLIFR